MEVVGLIPGIPLLPSRTNWYDSFYVRKHLKSCSEDKIILSCFSDLKKFCFVDDNDCCNLAANGTNSIGTLE